MQTSQGYIFRILQHFVTKFCNFRDRSLFIPGVGTEEKRKTL
jgi:hypothetical protein